MNKNMMKVIIAVLAISLTISACNLPTTTETPIATNDATLPEITLETLPPPLENVEFPEDVKPYPVDWPADLHFPESFKSVDFNQGTLPGGNKLGKSLKLRFNGSIQDAIDGLRTFLNEKGWKIVDETDMDTGGKLWIIEKDGGGTGMIIIDAQGSDKIVIIATFYV